MFCTQTGEGKWKDPSFPSPVPAHLLGLNSSPTPTPSVSVYWAPAAFWTSLFCLLSLLSQLPVGRALSTSHVGKGEGAEQVVPSLGPYP